MTAATAPLYRQISTAKPLKTITSSLRKPNTREQNIAQLCEDRCSEILDRNPDARTLKKLHSKIVIDGKLQSSFSICIKLMRSYAACGEPNFARHLFDKMSQRNVVAYNVIIRSYTNNHLYHDALLLCKTMSCNGIQPDRFTYPCALKACSNLGDLWVGLQIHGAVLKAGHNLHVFIGSGLVAMYGKCGCLVEARRVLDGMPGREVVHWNAMVAGYVKNGRFDDALKCCREMESLGMSPDSKTMATLFPAVTNTSLENVLYVKDMFAKVSKKNVVPWNVMIGVYVKNSMALEAINLFIKMEAYGIEPDCMTITSVLPACGDVSDQSLGRRIHEYAKGKKLLPNLALERALFNMYVKWGCLREARAVFDQMQFRDVVLWTELISAYGRNRQGRDAVDLFTKMIKSGLNPDSVAFSSVLSACSRAGLLEEGRDLFILMTKEYQIVPERKHLASIVNLLGRVGKINGGL